MRAVWPAKGTLECALQTLEQLLTLPRGEGLPKAEVGRLRGELMGLSHRLQALALSLERETETAAAGPSPDWLGTPDLLGVRDVRLSPKPQPVVPDMGLDMDMDRSAKSLRPVSESEEGRAPSRPAPGLAPPAVPAAPAGSFQAADLKGPGGQPEPEASAVRCMCRPMAKRRMLWDFATVVFLVYVAFLESYRLGFDPAPPESGSLLAVADGAVNTFFLADIFVNFRTGYLERGDTMREVMEPKRVALNYLRTWFALDFASSVPPVFELLLPSAAGSEAAASMRSAKLLKWSRLLRFAKLMRMPSRVASGTAAGEFFDELLLSASSTSRLLVKLLKIFASFLLISHLLTCFLAFSGDGFFWTYADDAAEGVDEDGEPLPLSLPASHWVRERRYLLALYWTVQTMTTVGYGDVTPASEAERGYALVGMVIGAGYYGYIVAFATTVVSAANAHNSHYTEKMVRVQSWLEFHAFPVVLRRRIIQYYRVHYTHRPAFDERTILDDLAPMLQEEVAGLLIHPVVRSNFLFDKLPQGALAKLIPMIRHHSALPNEEVVTQGSNTHTLFILWEGRALSRQLREAFAASSKRSAPEELQVVEEFFPGASFGELAVLGVDSIADRTVTAQEFSRFFVISADAFLETFQKLPEALTSMRARMREVRKRAEESRSGLRVEGKREVIGGFHYGMGWLRHDPRKFWSPPAARNGSKILEVLLSHIADSSETRGNLVVEVASGGGQHAAQCAKALPHLKWQPTEIAGGCPNPLDSPFEETGPMFRSIEAFCEGLPNVLPPRELDAREPVWFVETDPLPRPKVCAIVAINLLHITEIAVTRGIFAAAGRLLQGPEKKNGRARGWLFIYGAFFTDVNRDDESTLDFDLEVRSTNPNWGVRDVRELGEIAMEHGLAPVATVPQPAGNWVLVFTKQPALNPYA